MTAHGQALLESMGRHLRSGFEAVSTRGLQLSGESAPLSAVELAASLRDLIRNERQAARHLCHIGRQDTAVCDG